MKQPVEVVSSQGARPRVRGALLEILGIRSCSFIVHASQRFCILPSNSKWNEGLAADYICPKQSCTLLFSFSRYYCSLDFHGFCCISLRLFPSLTRVHPLLYH